MKKQEARCPTCGGLRLTATTCGVCKKEICFNCMYVRYLHWNSWPAIRCKDCAKDCPEFKKFTD